MNQIIQTAWNYQEETVVLPEREELKARGFTPVLFNEASFHQDIRSPLDRTPNLFLKRGFDILISSLVIVFVLSWVLPLLWLINRFLYKQSLFFIQERNGLHNETFRCIKFKTMIDTDEANLKSAAVNDPRITPIGHLLRKSCLDELPQFLNIFFGHMSVIGPRPHMLYHTALYKKIIPGFMFRHSIKPGLTGLAQVNRCRGSIHSFRHLQQRLNHDLAYIENWTFWMDLKIVGLTIFSIFKGGNDAW